MRARSEAPLGAPCTPLSTIAATLMSKEYDDVDLAQAAACVKHFVGCALLGAQLPWSQAVRDMARTSPPLHGRGFSVIGLDRGVAAQEAVFTNAVLGQSTLAEDVHVPSLVHPGSIVIPAALAAAEQVGADTVALLKAVLMGYDALAAVGTSLKTSEFAAKGLRPSGVFGPFGSAAAASALFGQDLTTRVHALAIAGNTGAGFREWATAGSTDVYLQNGTAAWNGYFAAVLAGQGLTGPASLLEGEAGIAVAFSGPIDWATLDDLEQRRAAVHDVEFKRFPACSGIQAVVELAVRTAREQVITPHEIESITVYTHHHGKTNPGCDSAGPWEGIGQAQMSNQLGVAMALLGAPMRATDYATHYRRDDTLALAHRVGVIEDPVLTAAYPGRSGARLVIEAHDGRVIERELDRATPLSGPEIDDFTNGAISATVAPATQLKHVLDVLVEPHPVHDLLDILRRASIDL